MPAAHRRLTLVEALLPIATMALLLGVAALTMDVGAEVFVAVLIESATVAGGIAVRHGHTWDEIQVQRARN